MDVPELLDRAVAMVPANATNEAGAAAADVAEYLKHNEWEVALDLLADLDDWPASFMPPASYRRTIATRSGSTEVCS